MSAPAPGRARNSLGVWSLVLGGASFLLLLGVLTGIPAILVGNDGRRAVRAGQADNEAVATAGVVLGWASVAATLVGAGIVAYMMVSGDR
ncbi:DUF4190 domain-containing protein [Myceligenerans pegani]|uniref:DUF4190 domain-containing protein n=1 Tax=Myceligenerans pegani TaxID=2776917 RepID=A0ABR9MZS2_9MICO|nr:DUF4190 domain-containing protein [Myceligenerans sp. TRM 65318]MBE1876899.1 DUF4190 domain-containing protein [Myceligenerans sp. TRM 65318]MBE3019170.1 DUF4190 domain-containing protein [Myceligenerans sp. TRM 65318]